MPSSSVRLPSYILGQWWQQSGKKMTRYPKVEGSSPATAADTG
jgi:hypothetical protein